MTVSQFFDIFPTTVIYFSIQRRPTVFVTFLFYIIFVTIYLNEIKLFAFLERTV